MFIVFEDAKKIHAGRVLSQTEASAQVELETGKRVKVKQAHILLSFEQPSATEVLDVAQELSTTIDVQLLWEFSPDGEFGFEELAQEYFQDPTTLEQQAATFLALFAAPHYFRRAGGAKGRFKKAPEEEVKKALLAIEKKAQIQAQIDAWVNDLVNLQCPDAIYQQRYKILFKPDKNTSEYKAVAQAAQASAQSLFEVLQHAGAIASAYELHWQRFLFECFPQGTGFANLDATAVDLSSLPVADVDAFSIDDADTTEIDDALSVTGLNSARVTIGVHIAAPALAMQVGDALDVCARSRLSTVYMPGYKITMLPDAVVQQYTLEANTLRPCVSLYCTFDSASFQLLEARSAIEQITVAHNLRTNTLDAIVTADWLAQDSANLPADNPKELVRYHAELAFLWRLAQHHKVAREVVRGKPELFNRPDFKFALERTRTSDKNTPPTGNEVVHISQRMRGTPLDLIVSEAMIMANHEWAKLLSSGGVAAIYRSQAALQPGIKVRMNTQAQLHAGIGVSCYAWCTSPLRRYVDLVNQWQLIACIQHGATAALSAPFQPKDTDLLAIITAFDATYANYKQFQSNMELYWTLQYLQRHNIQELEASLIRDGKDALARAEGYPLVLPVIGAENTPLRARVRIQLGNIDFTTLFVSSTFIARIEEDKPDENATDTPNTSNA